MLHRGRDRVLRRHLRHDRRGRAARAHGRRARTRCPAAAPRSSPSACAGRSVTTRPTPIAISPSTAPRTGLGLRSNVTMLYGHIETMEERVDHMLRARALQDETGGLQAFIPLAFHPDNNQMRKLPAPSASDTLRVHAVARLMLDNMPHVKAFWIATGVDVAQIVAVVRRGRPRRDRAGREDLPHGRRAHAGDAARRTAIRRLIRAAGRTAG